MKLFSSATCFSCVLFFLGCSPKQDSSSELQLPTNGIEVNDLQTEEESSNARERYENLIHHTPDSVDWRGINRQNHLQLFRQTKLDPSGGSRAIESFANGQLTGEWEERGSANQAGNLRSVDYEADENKIYGIADGGSLFRANLDGTGWELLEDDLQFENGMIQVVPNGSGKRILSCIGKQIWYSDDNGSTWTQSTGLVYYDNWGSGQQLVALNNGNDIYFLVFTWNQSPWGSRIWLMYSSDKGSSFSHIHTFDHNGNYWAARNYTRIWQPYNSNELYAVHTSTGEGTYSVSGNTVTLLNSTTTIPANSELRISGYKVGGTFNLYALVSSNSLYKTSDSGATWTLVGNTPTNAWSVGIHASPFDANKLFYGEVEAYRSYDQGTTWTKVNNWWEYYSNTHKLHADIMDIGSFEKSDGTKFMLICNHGGLHVSYDNLTTTTNISTSGLNISQYYDVRTDPTNSNYIYAGSQDQGHQRTSLGNNGGSVNFDQIISGDYGEYSFSQNGTRLWTVYPFGAIQYRPIPQTSSTKADFSIPGTTAPAGGWIYPTAEVAIASDNKIYVAGGNLSGGSGSYLITLTGSNSAPWTISASQGSFDFNSQSGKPISAIAASKVNSSKLFVATENGKFYYSNDSGATWTQSSSTGTNAYINCILPSAINSNQLWISGNGYSDPGVLKSTDGGQTFTSASSGLPATQVRQIAANPSETLLFAATDAGPYVFVVSENQWYTLTGSITPIQSYRSVEYVSSSNTVRFGTYGRGIWDLNIQSQPLPLEWLSFSLRQLDNQQIALSWETANEYNVSHFEIERSGNGHEFVQIGKMSADGTGKYNWNDSQVLSGAVYYRLKQVDLDGQFSYSPIRVITLPVSRIVNSIAPNPTRDGHFKATFEKSDEPVIIAIWSLDGRKLLQQTFSGESGSADVFLPAYAADGNIVLVEMISVNKRDVFKLVLLSN